LSISSERNIPYGKVILSPSYYFSAKWVEGTFSHNGGTPYANATMVVKINNPDYYIASTDWVTITFYKENGIGAICGHMNSTLYNTTGLYCVVYMLFIEFLYCAIDKQWFLII
jgi:hypothetical protein